MNSITVEQLAEKIRSGNEEIDLIDVRTPVEFREVHAQGAQNVPLDSFDVEAFRQSHSNGHAIYVICQSGNRSSKAYQKLADAGLPNIVNVEGGTKSWEAADLPVVRGKKAISLERQVRIAAGFLVLLGAVLGAFVHPWFIGLSAFVGAGLMFAGITDTCGMGMLLAKMPWNQVRGGQSESCSVS